MAGSHEGPVRQTAIGGRKWRGLCTNAAKTLVNFAFCRFWLGDMLGKSSL
jgi:hypothetical protein